MARNKSGQARTRDEGKPTEREKRPGSNGRNQSAIQQRNLGASQQTASSVHKKAYLQGKELMLDQPASAI